MRSRLLLRVLTVACLARLLRRRPAVVRASCSTPCRLGDDCACYREGWNDRHEWSGLLERFDLTADQGVKIHRLARDLAERFPDDPLLDESRLHDDEPPTLDTLATYGYVDGPTLQPGERPWSLGWEQRPQCGDHRWERVTVVRAGAAPSEPATGEDVVRCAECHVPRCGSSMDMDPCMLERHHHEFHKPLHGARYPVGGR